MPKMIILKHTRTSTLIKLSLLEMLIQKYKCGIRLAVWDYTAVISNPNTSISKIIDLVRPVDEWSEIAFSDRQNAENEHC